MVSVQEIRNLVSACVLGSINEGDFARRFGSIFRAVHRAGDDHEAIALVNQVDSCVCRYFDGFMSQSSFRVELNRIVPTIKVTHIPTFSIDFFQHGSPSQAVPVSVTGSYSYPLPNVSEQVFGEMRSEEMRLAS